MNKLLLILLLLILPFNVPYNHLEDKGVLQPDTANYRDSIIAVIKIHEGLRLSTYSCSAGYTTIGYGHVITKNDHFSIPITLYQADSILEEDISLAETYYNTSVTVPQLSNQKWAIIHFIFCKGIGNFNKSTLKRLIIQNSPVDSICNEFLKWSYFKKPKTKEVVFSEWSYKIRQVEVSLYKKKTVSNIKF